MDLETRVVNWPVLILHFDCVKIGEDGISWMKPEDYGSAAHATQPGKPEICGPEEYDHVDFEPDSIETSSNQTSSTLTPEEEDHIGQLKLWSLCIINDGMILWLEINLLIALSKYVIYNYLLE